MKHHLLVKTGVATFASFALVAAGATIANADTLNTDDPLNLNQTLNVDSIVNLENPDVSHVDVLLPEASTDPVAPIFSYEVDDTLLVDEEITPLLNDDTENLNTEVLNTDVDVENTDEILLVDNEATSPLISTDPEALNTAGVVDEENDGFVIKIIAIIIVAGIMGGCIAHDIIKKR